MALTLDSTQSSLNRPTRPKDPNGISRAVRTGGTGAQTAMDRLEDEIQKYVDGGDPISFVIG
jgi:hypothetical protein